MHKMDGTSPEIAQATFGKVPFLFHIVQAGFDKVWYIFH